VYGFPCHFSSIVASPLTPTYRTFVKKSEPPDPGKATVALNILAGAEWPWLPSARHPQARTSTGAGGAVVAVVTT
jgi:hypothetical protein